MVRSWHVAFGERGHADLVRDVTRCDLDLVVTSYYKHNHYMLYDKFVCDLTLVLYTRNVYRVLL